jgi:hypothetical protein
MNFYYYGIENRGLKAFREDGETVFSAEYHGKPIACVNENIWYDWESRKPIAFEEDDIVYNLETKRPMFVISIE